MIKSLLSSKEVLLTVVPGEDGELLVRHAVMDGRRILKTGEGVPSRLPGPVRASIFSLSSYFEQVDLAAASPKLLPLVARRHLDAELVFDQSYRLRARGRAKGDRTIAAEIAAMPAFDLEAAQALIPLEQQPCPQMVPLELSIAALVRKATAEPVIVFWERGGVLLSLLVAGGLVRARMRDKVSDEDRGAIIARAESSLRGRASHFGERRDVFLVLYTGDLSERPPANREKAVRAFEAKLARLYRGRKGVAEEAVLRDPEIYGLPFVDEEWSFLEKGYRDQVQSWRYARPAAGLAGLVGVGFALFGGFQHVQALAAAHDFDNQRAELQKTLADIERILPSEQAMESARSGLQVQMDSLSEVRLDRMLDWVTHLVPEDMAIRRLEVKPVPPPRGRRNVSVEYPPGEKPFQVRIEIVLAETAFDAAEAVSGDLVKRLSQRLQIVGSRLDVPAPEPGVGRKVALVVDAQARAVNF